MVTGDSQDANTKRLKVRTAWSDEAEKEQLWKDYVEGKKYKQKEFGASASVFYNWRDEKMIRKFGERFFDDVEKVFETQHRDYAQTFFWRLLPVVLGEKKHVERMEEILKRTHEDRTHFRNLLKEGIADVESMIRMRESLQKK